MTATALHGSGQADTLEIQGDWAPGSHTVSVTLVNDLWGGTSDTDRNVYIDLSSAAVAGSKVFIIDQNCDGLASKPGDNGVPDSWEGSKQQLSFDGEWKKAKMTEQDYMKALAAADERYAQVLAALLAELKKTS